MRVDGYVRVSTEEQAEDGKSLPLQRDKIRDYARLYDLTVCDLVEDAGVSAKTLDRPGLTRVLERLRRGEIEGIIITKLDRLTRSLADWSYLIDEYFCEKKGKALFSVGDSVNTTTATGRMVLNVIMTIAQWEREIIAERTREVLRGKIKRGERCGKVRYGHDLALDGKTLVDNPVEQTVISVMRAWRSEGRTYRAIVEALGLQGIPTKEGGVWTPSTVKRILERSA